ncbi:MAG: hypothetical protein F4137_24345 [Acidobacteria bacterium]|nr:hypothetical protein [Acidobacteriota bacterium]MYH31896.1 hypothetical protein [Acidobacteriota bacterium]
MHRTHKVQVTLDERQFAAVSRISRAGGRKLAAVVREAVERYCVAPEARRRRLDAIEALYAMEPAPAPTDLEQWQRDYDNLKTGLATGCAPHSERDSVGTRKRR